MTFLHLTDWHTSELVETDDQYLATAVYDRQPSACMWCGVIGNLYRHGKKQQRFLDAPVRGKRVTIVVERTRFKCRDCGHTFWQDLPDMAVDHQMTTRLVRYIERQALERPFTTVARDVGIDEKVVRTIFSAHAEQLDRRSRTVAPRWLGIDELVLLRQPRCILTDVYERRMLDLLRTRNQPAVAAALHHLIGRERIELVAMDMWKPYRRAVRAVLPQAQIIVDKFHVVRMVNQALDTVRRDLRDSMTRAQRKRLMRDRMLLLRRPQTLRPGHDLHLEAWLRNVPELGDAYRLKEQIFDLWGAATDAQEARERYAGWLAGVPPSIRAAFTPFITAMRNWDHEIFAYFDLEHHVTNAYTEALNGLIKQTNRIGRGYSFEVIRYKMLLHGEHRLMQRAVGDDHGVYETLPNFISEPLVPYTTQVLDHVGPDLSTLERLIRTGVFDK